MRDVEFSWFTDFLERKSGIIINADKKYLVQSRLKPLLRTHTVPDLNDLVMRIKRQESSPLAEQVVDAMTTNETLFFRDQYPYEALETLIFPELTHGKNSHRSINIWSAAASRGQEAYSIAIAASESIPQANKRVKILGTDLSKEAISYAQKAVYSQVEVQRGMPVTRLIRFFEKDEKGNTWHVSDGVKRMVKFQTGNLTDDRAMMLVRSHGPFDIVFLRNVLIYFSMEERKNVLDRVARTMNKGGYLITGAAELPTGNTSKWEHVLFKGKRLWKLV